MDTQWVARCKALLLAGVGVGIGANGVVVAVAPARLAGTYGIEVDGPDLAVLLRHRAVMLALIGSGLIASAFRRELRSAAVPAAAISMATYAALGFSGNVNEQLRGVAVADVGLLVLLAAAIALPERQRGHPAP